MYSRWLLTLIAAFSAGCATISEKCCHENNAPIGFVTSGGRYCVARSLAIPLEGLTLGKAVTQVLRVPRGTLVQSDSRPAPQRKVKLMPLGASTVAVDFGEQAASNFEQSGDVEDGNAHGLKNNLSNFVTDDEWKMLQPQFRECFERALKNGMLAGPTVDTLDGLNATDPKVVSQKNTRGQLANEIELTFVFGLLWQDPGAPEPGEDTVSRTVALINATQIFDFQKRSPLVQSQQAKSVSDTVRGAIKTNNLWPKQDQSFATGRALLFSIRQAAGDQTNADTDTTLLATNLAQPAAEIETNEQMIVTLGQTNGRLISAPLWLVTNYSAGDILLTPNDHVEVNAFNQTSFGSHSLQHAVGNILALGPTMDAEISTVEAVSGIQGSFQEFAKTRGASIADVVVIRRIEISGQLHDFILPIPRPEIYEHAGAASYMMDDVTLEPGDQLHLEVLDLTPMIRESRRMSQQASQIAIVEAAAAEADARRTWLQKRFVKHQEHKRRVCAQINTQTELVTGVNLTQLAILTDNFNDNLSAQVGMTP